MRFLLTALLLVTVIELAVGCTIFPRCWRKKREHSIPACTSDADCPLPGQACSSIDNEAVCTYPWLKRLVAAPPGKLMCRNDSDCPKSHKCVREGRSSRCEKR
ncbi:unnamed protein product, partial [Mesorhabditis spiculigera]